MKETKEEVMEKDLTHLHYHVGFLAFVIPSPQRALQLFKKKNLK